MAAPALQFRSFRDPSASVELTRETVLRFVKPEAAEGFSRLLESPFYSLLVGNGKVISTEPRPDLSDESSIAFEHPKVPFPNYPYEWSPAMLHAAAALTLDLTLTVLDQGFGLKDATPHNVLFRGPEPVFVDVASFEQRVPEDPVWLPYGQFVRTFLAPLMVQKFLHLPFQPHLLASRDGIQPESLWPSLSWRRRLRQPALELVTLPRIFSRSTPSQRSQTPRAAQDPDKARYILRKTVARLSRLLESLRPAAARSSEWSAYEEACPSYSTAQRAEKQSLVTEFLDAIRPQSVLDIGANRGTFSLLALARGASEVVAIDRDPAVIDYLFGLATRTRSNVLPLVVDFARPSPASGWENSESLSFLDRAHERFDCVLLLACIHHLGVGERIPLDEILQRVRKITRSAAIVEFVGPDDPMVRQLSVGREHLLSAWTTQAFESAANRHFEIAKIAPIADSQRTLYHLRCRP